MKAWPVQDIDPGASVLVNARRILAVRVAEFYSFAPAVNHPEHVEALHDLRIAAKRLRYSLELFRPQFGVPGERQIERVKAVQEVLGLLHDHDVRIALIGDELSRLAVEQSLATQASLAGASEHEFAVIAASALRPPPDDPKRGLIALLGREHAARRSAYAQFRQFWEANAASGMRQELVALTLTPLSQRERAAEPEA